jgi:serine/threonine-protein kinase
MGNSPATNDAGQEFHKYRLREPLSESFLGTRYRAVSSTSGSARAASAAFGSDSSGVRRTAFALRLMRAPSAGLIERVARAAKAVRFLEHPNVLAPIQLIRSQTRLGIITQDIDGFTLSEVMRKASSRGEALPQAVALRIALDVLEGVAALHALEPDATKYLFACGGLTPDSIHVGKDGRTRLLDPGVAGAAAALAFWGHDPVALAYTAPENSGAEPQFNPRSDVFSVGVMVWEMLAGRALFGAPTATETLENLHKSLVPRVQRTQFVRGEPIAAAVAQVVARALQRDPQQRFGSAHDLATALFDADDVSVHSEVAEHCHRLAANSAGVFDGAVRVRAVQAAPEFEIPLGTLSTLPTEPIKLPSIDSLHPYQSTAPQAPLPPDAFEPATAKIEAPLLAQLFPPRSFTPEHVERSIEPQRPITAFPISDLVRKSPVVRQVYAPLAAAAAILLAIAYLLFQSLSSHGDSPRSVAATQPPVAAPESPAPAPEPPPAAAAPTPAPAIEPMPPAFGGPEKPTVTVENTAAGAPVTPAQSEVVNATRGATQLKKLETGKKHGSKWSPDSNPKSDPNTGPTSNVPSGPFIPEGL